MGLSTFFITLDPLDPLLPYLERFQNLMTNCRDYDSQMLSRNIALLLCVASLVARLTFSSSMLHVEMVREPRDDMN